MKVSERFGHYVESHSRKEIIEDTLATMAALGAAALIAKAFEEIWGEIRWKKEQQ